MYRLPFGSRYVSRTLYVLLSGARVKPCRQLKYLKAPWAPFVSSPEPKGHWWAYSICMPLSSVAHCPSTFSNFFSSETNVPTEVKFHVALPRSEYINLYEYQMSWSSIDLGPRRLRVIIFNLFSLETARSIEAKFHVEPPWDAGTKVCSNDQCGRYAHTLVYGKNI